MNYRDILGKEKEDLYAIYKWLADRIEDILAMPAVDEKRKYWMIQMAYELVEEKRKEIANKVSEEINGGEEK